MIAAAAAPAAAAPTAPPAEALPELLLELVSALAVPLAAVVLVWIVAERLTGLLAQLVTRALGDRDRVVGRVTTGREGMIGGVGVARTELAPGGKVFVRGELWNAVAAEPVPRGGEVEIVAVDGLTLRVEPRRRPEPRVATPATPAEDPQSSQVESNAEGTEPASLPAARLRRRAGRG